MVAARLGDRTTWKRQAYAKLRIPECNNKSARRAKQLNQSRENWQEDAAPYDDKHLQANGNAVEEVRIRTGAKRKRAT
jgi:hypothetical protein